LTIARGGCWAATGAAQSNAVKRAATKDVRMPSIPKKRRGYQIGHRFCQIGPP
jgi:hypothetical protein